MVEVILTPVPGSFWFSMGVSMVSGRRNSSFFLWEIEDSILMTNCGTTYICNDKMVISHRKTRQQAVTLFMQLRVRLVWLVRSEQNFIWNENQKFRVVFFCVHLCLSVLLLVLCCTFYSSDTFWRRLYGDQMEGKCPFKGQIFPKPESNNPICFVKFDNTRIGWRNRISLMRRTAVWDLD